MKAKFEKRNDSEWWVCPVCASRIGGLTTAKQAPSLEAFSAAGKEFKAACNSLADIREGDIEAIGDGIFARLEKTATAIKLRAGYVFVSSKNVWLKPKKPRGFLTGHDKREVRQFAHHRLQNALNKSDYATIFDERWKLQQNAINKNLPQDEPLFFVENLPVEVLCPKPGRERPLTIPSLRDLV